jgi:glycosyltransferase involved in cell wall biosynthesis
MKLRIGLVVSHPIQHFCPQYVSFADNPDIVFKVFFASMLGYKKYFDQNFGKEISWNNLELEKFSHEFLNGEKVIPSDKKLDAPSLDRALDDFKPDVIITYGYFQVFQRRAHKWALRKNVPIAYISDSERRQQRPFFKEIIKYPYLRWYFSRISYFLTVGNANEAFYHYHGVKKERFIRMHFPIDIKNYFACYNEKVALGQRLRNEYRIAVDELVISVVGKMVPWKNQDHLIDAMIRLEQEDIHLHLFILGSGTQMEKWKQKSEALSKSKVHFTGFVNIEKLPSYYAASDIYIHPASVEPHSIAISEAIFMGCPVIISDRCGSYGETDDVQEGKNGWVYPFGNIEELVKKIKWMIAHPKERKKFGETAHQIACMFQERSHKQVIMDMLKKMI